jgi:hypothetical protein
MVDCGIPFPVYLEKTRKGTGDSAGFTCFGLCLEDGAWPAGFTDEISWGKDWPALLMFDCMGANAGLGLRDFTPEYLSSY